MTKQSYSNLLRCVSYVFFNTLRWQKPLDVDRTLHANSPKRRGKYGGRTGKAASNLSVVGDVWKGGMIARRSEEEGRRQTNRPLSVHARRDA